MRPVLNRGLLTVAAATGVLAVTGGAAHADAGAQGAATDSPGVLSGNVVQAPVHVPLNVCGNTVNVLALLNPAVGNTCVNGDSSKDKPKPEKPKPEKPRPEKPKPEKPGPENPPGPQEPPAEECPAAEEEPCDGGEETPEVPMTPQVPNQPQPQMPAQPPQLAQTGAGELGAATAMSAALLAGGVFFYRRSKVAQD